MHVTTLVLNADGEPHFQANNQLDVRELIALAKPREKLAKERGATWTTGAITFSGKGVIEAVNTGENDDVTRAIFQLLMAAWLFDSLYGGLTATHYLESDMEFIIAADGAVAHTRVDGVRKS
jgi:hypothetical protein